TMAAGRRTSHSTGRAPMSALRWAMNGAVSIIIPPAPTESRVGSKPALIVYGGEADINFFAAARTVAPWEVSNPWFGTVRGRAGFATDNVLLFGTGGFAYGKLTVTTANLSESHTSFGRVGGEVNFAQHWSAKAEWLYFNLGDRHFSVTAANNGLAANLVRLGLNYHF